jgi:DNA-binding MarR family transcriptional regulator
MDQTITEDQVVQSAENLGKPEFTRAELAERLGVDKPELKKAFHQARKAGRLDKVRDDEKGTGHFRLTGK